jgi:hypothetical protein
MVRTKTLGIPKARSGALIVRKPKTAAQAGKAAKPEPVKTAEPEPAASGAAKRKRKQPTKLELRRRLMRERKTAKRIQKEQNRSVTNRACSRNGIRRMIKEALIKDAESRRIDPTEPLKIPMFAKKAVEMIHEVLEEEAVSRFCQASHLLEYANRTTCTPATLQALDRAKMAFDKRPVFELPEAEPRPTPTAGVGVDAEQEEEEEEAAFTGSETGSESGSASDTEENAE